MLHSYVEMLKRREGVRPGVLAQVVSCEMIEAVGHDYLPAYFQAISTFLKPGGQAVIQVCSSQGCGSITRPLQGHCQSVACDCIEYVQMSPSCATLHTLLSHQARDKSIGNVDVVLPCRACTQKEI